MYNNKTPEKFLALVGAYKGDDLMLESLEDYMSTLAEYVTRVYAMETQMPILRFRLDGDDFRNAVMDLDKRRRAAHEGAIASISVMNRMAKMANVEVLYDGDLEDRLAVADFCMETVKVFFDNRVDGSKKISLQEWIDAAVKIG